MDFGLLESSLLHHFKQQYLAQKSVCVMDKILYVCFNFTTSTHENDQKFHTNLSLFVGCAFGIFKDIRTSFS
jgi:hypothetical protein